MRKAVVMFALVVGVLLLPGIRDVSAQSPTLAKVPFSFVVQGTVMPAGEYRIAMRQGDQTMMRIASTDGSVAAFVMVSSMDAGRGVAETTLKFARVANGHFLSSVSVPGEKVREIAVPSGAAAVRLAMLAAAKPGIQG
jgi:predicted aspartyl protease